MNRAFHLLAALLVILVVALLVTVMKGFRYAYEPAESNVLNHYRASPQKWDLWGKPLTDDEAARLQVSARTGGVKVDAALLRLGRSAFYKETFRNEVFLTDVMGILAGPLRLTNVVKAILALHGEGTTNLRVEVPETVTIGGRTFAKGSYFDTGLDVARGSFAPLGMATVIRGGKIRVGITCAACHATVDPQTKKVIEGAPNQDLNAGLLLALGTNSVPYFMHTDVNPLLSVSPDMDRQVASTAGTRVPLPRIVDLENKVDEALLQWPPGNFDSLTDLRADPTQLPGSFTWGNHPYGWSGNFIAGPFRGLSAQNNNVHALNSDSLLLAAASGPLFDIDPEVYVAILLQNAATKELRYDPRKDGTPSAFLAARRSTPGSPGINEVVLPASWPKGTLLTPDGTLTSSPGYPVWQQNNAMSAWQDTLVPPPAPFRTDESTKLLGHDVFRRAGCERCHSGDFLTNNLIVPATEVGTEPIRAQALQKSERNLAPPVIFAFDTPVPVPANAASLPVPVDPRVELPLAGTGTSQVDLGWARHGSAGGYKTPSLVGIYWSAPYLHDGGVAAGRDLRSQLGLSGTLQNGIAPDAANSLRAMIDRDLRARVIAANAASPALQRMNVRGSGHEYWVDGQAGFSAREQDAVIGFLLSYVPPR